MEKTKSNRSYRIAVLPGDGTGPEVVREAVKTVEAVADKEGFKLELPQVLVK
jgi:3-isopropylmalate dehydrogenase